MPTLDWIGKKAVVNHHREVPYRLIHCNRELSAGDPDAGNLLVQGDNLEALKALLPYYAGKVKCIYIDPPYNTGNEGWVYNDNVASPEIKAWLGKVVGKEAEDLSRNDKWLCMMYPRLRLLKDFLTEDGIVMVSIDDNECHSLRFLLQDVFKSNLVSSLVWVNEGNIDNQSKIKQLHEYVLVFENTKGSFGLPALVDPNIGEDSKLSNDKILNTIVKNGPKNPVSKISLPVGFPADFDEGEIAVPDDPKFWPQFDEPIKVSGGKITHSVDVRSGWSSKAICELFIQGGCRDVLDRKGQKTRFHITKSGAVFNEKDRSDNQSHVLSVMHNMGSVQESSAELASMGLEFSYPKPRRLIEYLIKMASKPGDIILDSFAGSGTTAHSVIGVNAESDKDRQFIVIEMDETTVSEITAPRLKSAINGYQPLNPPGKSVEPLGGGFRYCRLGTPLFNEFGDIDKGVIFPDLAAHVFFSETGSPLPKKVDCSTYFIGTHRDKALYLLFSSAEQGFPREVSGNVLTPDALAGLPALSNDFEGVRIVYAEGCTVSPERLKSEGVVFKQIPYQIEGS